MGGKTQQRVAGNVKPSSSGRIRDLLGNKHGGGKIITFSALSNNEPPIPAQANPGDTDNSDQTGATQILQTTSNAKPALVVRRVGNRDFFTRVRVPKDASNQRQSSKQGDSTNYSSTTTTSSKSTNDSGCDQIVLDTDKESINEQQSSESFCEEQLSKEVEANQVPTNEEKVYDFDTILDRLTQVQDLSAQNTADSLDEIDDDKIAQEREIIKLLKILIRDFKEDLSLEELDYIVRSIYKWVGLISKSEQQFLSDSVKSSFCVDVFNFIYYLIISAKMWEKTEDLAEKFPLMQVFLDDLNNFHSSNVYQDLIVLYFKLAPIKNLSHEDLAIIEALANILVDVDPKLMVSNTSLSDYLDTEIEFDPEFELPENSRYCKIDELKFKGFLAVCGLLTSHYRVVVVSSHAMLSKIMGTICESFQVSSVISGQDDIDNLSLVPPAALMSILTSRDSMMSALLSDYRVGDISVTIEPNSDSYTCTLAYLFVWDLVIQFIVGVDKEVGHRIIHCFKRLGLIQRLLDNVFMLLPPLGERDSLNFRIETEDNDTGTYNQQWCLSSFLKSPLKTTLKRPVNEIELAALHVYFSVALHMPVTVRKWYNNNSNKRLCNLVNEYTVKHISKVICSLEMESVQEKCQERVSEDRSNNLVIKARPTANEVYAIYTRDEFRMELTIKLPINYPLGSIQIDGGKRVGVTDLKWRSWLLQLTTFLSHQNGPILDGVYLWRRNIDKKFEGIEKCMICFSILHSNYQLPKKKCQACSKMFHNLCLYKWFETSGNSTCPLCRNIW